MRLFALLVVFIGLFQITSSLRQNSRLIRSSTKFRSVVTATIPISTTMEVKRSQTNSRNSIPIIVPTENRKIADVSIPSVDELKRKLNLSHKASHSDNLRSGGYPDVEVKKDVYLLVWASMVQNLKEQSLVEPNSRSLVNLQADCCEI